jgi:hypothetical protein
MGVADHYGNDKILLTLAHCPMGKLFLRLPNVMSAQRLHCDVWQEDTSA